jgi:hypothetical protein
MLKLTCWVAFSSTETSFLSAGYPIKIIIKAIAPVIRASSPANTKSLTKLRRPSVSQKGAAALRAMDDYSQHSLFSFPLLYICCTTTPLKKLQSSTSTVLPDIA